MTHSIYLFSTYVLPLHWCFVCQKARHIVIVKFVTIVKCTEDTLVSASYESHETHMSYTCISNSVQIYNAHTYMLYAHFTMCYHNKFTSFADLERGGKCLPTCFPVFFEACNFQNHHHTWTMLKLMQIKYTVLYV